MSCSSSLERQREPLGAAARGCRSAKLNGAPEPGLPDELEQNAFESLQRLSDPEISLSEHPSTRETLVEDERGRRLEQPAAERIDLA